MYSLSVLRGKSIILLYYNSVFRLSLLGAGLHRREPRMTIPVESLYVDTSHVPHFPLLEQMVEYINAKTQNPEKNFFRMMAAYYLSKVAASLRVTVVTKDRGNIPVNSYVVALAGSGYSKGHSVALLEGILDGFREIFTEHTLPLIAEINLGKIASQRAAQKSTDETIELEVVTKEYNSAGEMLFTFDSATTPAIKQMRSKLLMAGAGSLNLQIDEMSLNLLGATEPLTTFLELFDMGKTNAKLTKNSKDNTRVREIVGCTPANLLLFGTPTKVFDGSNVETQFAEMLEMGYARRCLFAFAITKPKVITKTPEQVYQELTNSSIGTLEGVLKDRFITLADIKFHEWKVTVPDKTAILLIKYKMYCEAVASSMPEHKSIEAAELSHRYFKALKLAGAFAFSDLQSEITETLLLQAIKLVEESGVAFEAIRTREKNYVRLAKYIATTDAEVTSADLVEQLPFFRGSIAVRTEMLKLAAAWGFSNHTIITVRKVGDIELYSGERLKETDPSKLLVSYSEDLAEGYETERCSVADLPVLATTPNINWCNHAFKDNHRLEANAIPEFNLVVIDVDGGFSAKAAHELLKPYVHMIYTTKRSTPDNNRFRVVMPISHVLKLSAEDYRQFMINIMNWLPFAGDEAANQRSRKWLSNPSGDVILNDDGVLLDVLPFIPRSAKEPTKAVIANATKLEAWFLNKLEDLGRNNMLLRYGLALVDSGLPLLEINSSVLAFNKKLPEPLEQREIESTVFKTIASKFI